MACALSLRRSRAPSSRASLRARPSRAAESRSCTSRNALSRDLSSVSARARSSAALPRSRSAAAMASSRRPRRSSISVGRSASAARSARGLGLAGAQGLDLLARLVDAVLPKLLLGGDGLDALLPEPHFAGEAFERRLGAGVAERQSVASPRASSSGGFHHIERGKLAARRTGAARARRGLVEATAVRLLASASAPSCLLWARLSCSADAMASRVWSSSSRAWRTFSAAPWSRLALLVPFSGGRCFRFGGGKRRLGRLGIGFESFEPAPLDQPCTRRRCPCRPRRYSRPSATDRLLWRRGAARA